MKKCLLVFVITLMLSITSCVNNSEPNYSANIFNDENSVTVVSGNLSYSIPGSVVDQYDEAYKDTGFKIPVLIKYDIPDVGIISIYQANEQYSYEKYSELLDVDIAYVELFLELRSDEKLSSNLAYSEISTINDITVEQGSDLYILIDNEYSEYAASYGLELDEMEERVIMFLRNDTAYLITYKPVKGCYDEQVYNTFLDSINFVSLEEGTASAEENKFVKEYNEYLKEKNVTLNNFDVQYNMTNSVGKPFSLSGYAKLSDYYNYGFGKEIEASYFCLQVTPDGGSYSDRWYIYCNRNSFQKIFDKALDKGEIYIMAVCTIPKSNYDVNQQCMAKLDYAIF